MMHPGMNISSLLKNKYSQTCVKRLYTTRHILGFSRQLVVYCSMKVVHELSALLSFSNKQPPVNSDFHVT